MPKIDYDVPFRDPVLIDELLSDKKNYNVFFVCSHGSLAENKDKGEFQPSPNTILIYTGAGQPGFPIMTNKEIEKGWMNLFDPTNIKRTFAAFLGLYEGHTDLLYKVPNDRMLSPELFLTISDTDLVEDIGFWGVYKHNGNIGSRREFSNVEEIPKLTKELYEGLFASTMVNHIHTMYKHQNKINIIMFISCRTAHKLETRISDYSISSSIFFSPTHYMLEYKPSGLDDHVPHEKNASNHKRIYLDYLGVLFPIDPEDRNQTVKELLQFLRIKYKLFDFPGVKSITIFKYNYKGLKGFARFPLQSDVIFEYQWDESYLTNNNGKKTLLIHPLFHYDKNVNRQCFANTDCYNPENLETHEIIRRGKVTRGTRKRSYSRTEKSFKPNHNEKQRSVL